MEWTICGLTARPGEKVQGYFAGPDGEKTIPICLIHGTKPGKTVLLTAGVHACEYPGAAAVMELCRELEPSQVSGRLILVPMLNVSSFYERLPFVVKEDGKNLNRMFPGDPQGSYSQQLAAQIRRELHAKADYLIDIHSGDAPELVMPFVYYPALARPEVLAESQRMCRAMSVACRVASTSMVGTSGTAAAIGTPAILIERGGQSGCSPEDQAAYREDLLSILAELGCLERPVTGNPRQMDITETAYYDAEANGCWHLLRQPGEEFQAGECLGLLTDFFGTVLQEITAPWDGFVLYGTVALGVRAGDSLLALARPPRG